MKKNDRFELALLLLISVVTVLLLFSFFHRENRYQHYGTETVSYEKAVVTEILDQELTLSGADGEYFTGFQKVKVELTDGVESGKIIEVDHHITLTHNIVAEEGTHVIICADRPADVEPYYTIFQYDRSRVILLVLVGFILLMAVIGRDRGIRAALGLGFTLAVILCYMIPQLYAGNSSMVTIATALFSSAVVSCFCISGLKKKTCMNILNTILGTAAAGIIYSMLIQLLHLHGGAMEEAEALQLISQSTGMPLKGIMFAGIVVGALGAVMDVAVSLGSSLWEIKVIKPSISKKELFHSGMNIGKDMIGTMSNTLIFAFAGGALPTLLIYFSYGVQYHQFLSSDFLALELVMGIAGSAAVMLTVPLSALTCAVMLSRGETS